jgi:redox-sensitive bicupin YhaK (pirin superfamily)
MRDSVITAQRRSLGGFDVARILPALEQRSVGPFVFLDHMGPKTFEPHFERNVDVRPHPHIGLATITYLFAGEITHRDSIGVEQAIRPGEVNWMTAGRGIAHSERFETLRQHGGVLDGLQAWIALPADKEEVEPAFAHVGAADLPTLSRNGTVIRVIAGDVYGIRSPVDTLSPLFYAHVELEAGADISMPGDFRERAAFVADGRVRTASGGLAVVDQMVTFGEGESATLTAEVPTTLMLLGGEPLGTRHLWWNFVSSRPERIEQAKADWRARKFATPINDAQEWIPLPGDPPPPAEPL